MDGLKPWARQELEQRSVQDLTDALTTADSLVEYKTQEKTDSHRGKGKIGGDKMKDKSSTKDGESSRRRDKFTREKSKGEKKEYNPLTCFLCDGNHLMKECSTRSKLNSIISKDEEPEPEKLKLESIMLSSIKTKRFSNHKGAHTLANFPRSAVKLFKSVPIANSRCNSKENMLLI
ncbi:hypothetical protein V2J09_020642 [Rumex salicifolius]